ncbi:MAG: hypothetical protein QXN59_02075 [Candidatus Micrarchaeaceae archaeon]
MMVGFKYYSNIKIGAALLLAIGLIVFLVTIRVEHLFIFALPKPVIIHVPPPTPAQICGRNLSTSVGFVSTLTSPASSILANMSAYYNASNSIQNSSIKALRNLYFVTSSANSSVYNLGSVSGINLSSEISRGSVCSLGNVNQNLSQADVLGVLLRYHINIFNNYSSAAKFNALSINASNLPTPLWANASRYISVHPNDAFIALYEIALLRSLIASINSTKSYIASAGLEAMGQQSFYIQPGSPLDGVMLSGMPYSENLSEVGILGYLPQAMPLIAAADYSCINEPYQSTSCAPKSNETEKRLALYELISEQLAGDSLYQILYSKSLNPEIAFAAYSSNSLVIDVNNAPNGALSNATVLINGKYYPYTSFMSYLYVNASLSHGLHNITVKSPLLKLNANIYVNPGLYVSIGPYEQNGSSYISIYNPGKSNVTIYNIKAANQFPSNSIVPLAVIKPNESSSFIFRGNPCNETGLQVPVYVGFNSSEGTGLYYTTAACA